MSQENVEIVRRLYEIKGGKVVSMRTFTDRAEALEAVGLSE